MSDLTDCNGMEDLYRERAKADPQHSGKWLGQAERWRELAHSESAWGSATEKLDRRSAALSAVRLRSAAAVTSSYRSNQIRALGGSGSSCADLIWRTLPSLDSTG